jgi:hypothetical protein
MVAIKFATTSTPPTKQVAQFLVNGQFKQVTQRKLIANNLISNAHKSGSCQWPCSRRITATTQPKLIANNLNSNAHKAVSFLPTRLILHCCLPTRSPCRTVVVDHLPTINPL